MEEKKINSTEELRKAVEAYQRGTVNHEEQDRSKMTSEQRWVTSGSPVFEGTGLGITYRYPDEKMKSGYGSSRYDSRISFTPGMDLEDVRAKEQPNVWKAVNGLIKMGTTAGTTYLNSTAGLVIGTLNSALRGTKAIFTPKDDREESIGSAFLNGYTNNFITDTMISLNQTAEELFPNYRTAYERSDQYQNEWYKHMFEANYFWDTIVKNFGFTIGSIGAASSMLKTLGKTTSRKVTGDFVKGLTAASKDPAVKEAFATARAASRGTLQAGTGDIVGATGKAAKRLVTGDIKMNVLGSTLGALGEGLMEGGMAKDEFLTQYMSDLDRNFSEAYQSIQDRILSENPDEYLIKRTIINEDGVPEIVTEITEAGRDAIAMEQSRMAKQYTELREYAKRQGNNLASTVFLLNLPILTMSNTVQFGRLFSGGWRTARESVTPKVRGKMFIGESVKGSFRSSMSKTGAVMKGVYRTVKSGASEAVEEMMQGVVSSGAERVADTRLASYAINGEDANEIKAFSSDWFVNMFSGGADYLSDFSNWQEAAIGAITGLFGMPGKRWHGGIPEAIRTTRAERQATKTAADKLNSLVNGEDFQKRWKDYIRHQKYSTDMGKAAENDNQYAWHNANEAQLISDVMTFERAGRLDDLLSLVDYYSNVPVTDAQSIREAQTSEGNQIDMQNKSDEQIIQDIRNRARNVKNTIKQYAEVKDNLRTISRQDTSEELLDELVFTNMQLKSSEKRFLTLFDEVMTVLNPIISNPSFAALVTGKLRDNLPEEDLTSTEMLRNMVEASLGSLTTYNMSDKQHETIDKVLDVMSSVIADDTVKGKIKDMKKLARDRQAFYDKLITLKDMSNEEFDNEIKEEKDAVKKNVEQQETSTDDGLKSMDDVKSTFFNTPVNSREALVAEWRKQGNKNRAVSDFISLYDVYYLIRNKVIDKDMAKYREKYNIPPMFFMTIFIQDTMGEFTQSILRKAKSVDQLLEDLDSVLPTFEEYSNHYYASKGKDVKVDDATLKSIYDAAVERFHNNIPAILSEAKKDSETASGFSEVQKGKQSASSSEQSKQKSEVKPVPGDGKDAAGEGSPAPKAKQEEQGKKPAEDPSTKVDESAEDEERNLIAEGSSQTIGEQYKDQAAEYASETPVQVPKDTNGNEVYYRTSIPEIASWKAAMIRELFGRYYSGNELTAEQIKEISDALDKLQVVDFYLEDDVKDDNGKVIHRGGRSYKDMWTALSKRRAFYNIAEVLQVGDKIEFVIDPTFPKYRNTRTGQDEVQILMTVVKNGQRHVLNILSGQVSKYSGLRELRDTILKEYSGFSKRYPNRVYVFGETSRVWSKRKGVVLYNDKINEKSISEIEGYNENAPIFFINKDDQPVFISKNKPSVDLKEYMKPGHVYYLAQNGPTYTPIRLNIEHLDITNKDTSNPLFNKGRSFAEDVRKVVVEFMNEYEMGNSPDIVEANKKLHKAISNLKKVVHITDLYFNIEMNKDGDPYLKIIRNYKSKGKQEEYDDYGLADIDKVNFIWDYLASQERAFNIDSNSENNLGEIIESGILTSNAKKMYAVGQDFWIDPWDPNTGKFTNPTNPETAPQQEPDGTDAPSAPGQAPVEQRSEGELIIVDQLINQLKGILKGLGLKVHGRAAMEEYLKSHDVGGVQMYINKNSLPKEELRVLSSALMSRFGNNPNYGGVVNTSNYSYIVNYRGEGEFDIIEYHAIDNNINERYDDREGTDVSGSLDGLSERDEITEREYNSSSYHVEDGEANGNDAALDQDTLQRESDKITSHASSQEHQGWRSIKRDSATGRIAFVEDGRTISVDSDALEFFLTPQGEVYGFLDNEGNIYLDETIIRVEHPIHEYTHLWDRIVQKSNPKLWRRGVALMKQIPLWNEILNDSNYGKAWQARGITGERLENLIASEVHARLVGENGREIIEKISEEKSKYPITWRLQDWLKEFWKGLKETFGIWSEKDLGKLTLEELNMMTLRDFAQGRDLSIIKQQLQAQQQSQAQEQSQDQPQSQDQEQSPSQPQEQTPSQTEVEAELRPEGDVVVTGYTTYDELSDRQKKILEDLGISEDDFKYAPEEQRERWVSCEGL